MKLVIFAACGTGLTKLSAYVQISEKILFEIVGIGHIEEMSCKDLLRIN